MVKDNYSKILGNSAILYVRMFITAILSIYSSRLILQYLGVDDYGIYNVVGGIVGMIGVLNTVLVSTTNRFLAVEIGKGISESVNKVYGTSIVIHGVLVVITLSIGLMIRDSMILNNLKIDISKMHEAKFVYNSALVVLGSSIFSVPFVALITAFEEFRFQALLHMAQSALTILIAVSLSLWELQRLEVYETMIALLNAAVSICFFSYAKWKFVEVKANFNLEKFMLRDMMYFSVWMSLGTIAYIVKNQGAIVLINVFFGTAINGAYALALMINAQLSQFSQNVHRAFVPSITKSFSQGDLKRSFDMAMQSCKFSFMSTCIVAMPAIVMMDEIFELWLVEPPLMSADFCRLMFIEALIINLHLGLGTFVFASGNVRFYQIAINSLAILVLPISYVFFRLSFDPNTIIYLSIFMSTLMFIVRHYVLKKLLSIRFSTIYHGLYKSVLKVVIFVLGLVYLYNNYDFSSSSNAIQHFTFMVIYCGVIIVLFGLNPNERRYIRGIMRDKYLNFKNGQ